ncbi:MAG TPA: kelch repeat-containing protein, partial [Gemmatimonadaceae bacterium]|nr:kelch repeat-containing protein [Gemmatimonadaceae bacterium]
MLQPNRCLVVAVLLAAGCSSGAGEHVAPLRASLTAAESAVFVGGRTRLIASFDGDEAGIDGVGPVENGVPVETPPLSRATTFTLRVRRGQEHAEAQATVEARYRNAFRILRDAPIAQTTHLAAPLPDGRAILMGGNTSETPNVPDSTLTQVFDPATETFARGPELLFSAAAHEFTSLVQLSSGGFLLAGGGINAGLGGRTSAATQMFDPAGARFVEVGDAVVSGVSGRTSVPLGDGGALLTGGFVSNRAERYDPVTTKWRAVGSMLHVRGGHTATLLRDGRVLIAGGSTCCEQPAP